MKKTPEPKPLIQIISEEEFLPIIQESCPMFFQVCNTFKSLLVEKNDITKKFYSNLIQESEFLESFLDEHGARENKTWYFFAEYIASIRNLAIAAFFIKHIVDRYPYYKLQEPDAIQPRFLVEAQAALEFLSRSILNLFNEAVMAGGENGLKIPRDAIHSEEFPEFQSNRHLPRNIREDKVKDEEERVVDLCEKVRKADKAMRDIEIVWPAPEAELQKIIPDRINEKNARMFSNQIHSIQSDFDTYIKNTEVTTRYLNLKYIRGYISIALHLQEVTLWLAHFYERHEDSIRQGECKTKISSLVDKAGLLDRLCNFAFFFSLEYLGEAAKLCDDILSKVRKVMRYELPIPKPHGFHARPSTYISLIVREYGKDVFLLVDGEKYNAKSVMSLLQAGGVIADKGYQTVEFEGDKRALDDIKALARCNYCEDLELPPELSYLKVLTGAP